MYYNENPSFSYMEYVDIYTREGSKFGLAALDYKKAFIPNTLYKYGYFPKTSRCETDRNDRIVALTEEKIWMSKRELLNDPTEFKHVLAFTAQTMFEKFAVIRIMNNRGVICLAKHFDNKLMWSHYSNSHNGYCIEYIVQNKDPIFPVEYISGSIPDYKPFLEKFISGRKSIIDGTATEDVKQNAIAISPLFVGYKDSCWDYEEEFRISDFVDSNGITGDLVNHKITGKLISTGKSTDDLIMSKIICGAECSEEDREILKQVCISINEKRFKQGIKSIEFARMKYTRDLKLVLIGISLN
jgi:hypothetical protein